MVLMPGHTKHWYDCAEETRPAGYKLRRDEFIVPNQAEQQHEGPAQSLADSAAPPDRMPQSSPVQEEEAQSYAAEEEEEDDIPDAGAIEEEPSGESGVSMAAPSEHASSSSDDNVLVSTSLCNLFHLSAIFSTQHVLCRSCCLIL